ncbi:flagellar basal body P-ring formation chaperone FlgA [Ectopseudomonas mendocina]|uniref:Flagella basal body P-ring formation protein FlgA n=1 Tax=Ectopseudomonas mendocina TaxID=300 RepID=A0ABZ2RIC6_ECTME
MQLIYNDFTGDHSAQNHAGLTRNDASVPACGSIFSACLALLFLFLPSHATATTATGQIEARVTEHVQHTVDEYARQQGWRNVRHTVQISLIGKSEQLSPCMQPLQLQAEPVADISARMRLQLTCTDTPGWTLSAFAQTTLYVQAVHAATLIDRNSTLSSNQLRLEEIQWSKSNRGFFQTPQEVSGQGAKRRIREGQLITPSLLSTPLMIRRGDPVTIRASQDGISAATKGQALANGRAGEVIRVRNLSSEKVIEAKVLEPGVVSSTFQ